MTLHPYYSWTADVVAGTGVEVLLPWGRGCWRLPAARLVKVRISRVVHDGYGYLMQEFGIDIAGVVEPAHGLDLPPTAGPLIVRVRVLYPLLRAERREP